MATALPLSVVRGKTRARSGAGPMKTAARRVLTHPAGVFGLTVLVGFILMAICAPLIAPYDPIKQIVGHELRAPSAEHWLGTDEYGRDLFSRIVYGCRISMLVSLIAVSTGGFLGIVLGLFSGYRGGLVDAVLMRVVDVMLSYPAIILGIAIVAVIGAGMFNVAYALAIVNVPHFARVVRASVLTQMGQEYVSSAIAAGCCDRRIMFLHVLPNCFGPILVQASTAIGVAVIAEASLSFLGLGTQPPNPSWGSILGDGRAFLRRAWWYGVSPGIFLATFQLGLNFLANALRDAFDPRLIRSRG